MNNVQRNKLINELGNVAYVGKTEQERFELLTAKTVTARQPIQGKDIQKYLALQGKLLNIEGKKSTIAVANESVRMLEIFESFDVSEEAVRIALVSMLDSLIVESLITLVDKTVILAMGDKQISKAEELGFTRLKLGHLQGL